MDSELRANSFADKIVNLLKEGNTVHAISLFTDNKNNSEIHNNSWDLVPAVSQFLTEGTESDNSKVFKCCEKLIDIIAEQSKPEEVLLQFIEELETANEDTKFLMLLKPLRKVLLRVPDKRLTSLAWCFNAITSYLQKVELPEDFSLIGEERLLLDSNEIVNRITFLYTELELFSETFISELKTAPTKNIKERQNIICKFLIELLGKPLTFLSFDCYRNTKPRARIVAEKLLENIFQILSDPFIYLEVFDGSYEADLVKPHDLSLGTFYCLIFSQGICINAVPKIYNKVYILHNSLRFMIKMLTEENQFVIEKGVDLSFALVSTLDHLSLPYLLLDSEDHGKFCKVLSSVIIHNEIANVRKKTLNILHMYLWAFEHQGRYLLIYNLMNYLTHSGLKGYLVTQYKEMISYEIKKASWENISKYYRGCKMLDLIEKFTLLKQKEETDLVDDSDRIVSTLNFLRYIFIVDKTGNCTEILKFLPSVEEYIENLRNGLKMSRAHYELKIEDIYQEKVGDAEKRDCEVSISVAGKNLMEVSNNQKISILNMSLTTLDVIDSLLNRLVECIGFKNNIQ